MRASTSFTPCSLALLILYVFFHSVPQEARCQLIIEPYDPRIAPAYFCDDGPRLNWIQWAIGYRNIGSTTVCLDSETFRATGGFDPLTSTDIFPPDWCITKGGGGGGFAPVYRPDHTGDDTLYYTIYSGQDSITQRFLYTARQSPPYGLMGLNENSLINGGTVIEIRTDTLHDGMTFASIYVQSDTPQAHYYNEYLELTACAGVTIDSVVYADDFSEFTFTDMPTFPYTVGRAESLILHYDFIPRIIGKHKRPLVFYVNGGGTLVWSFEYRVYEKVGVPPARESPLLSLQNHPNPFTASTTINFTLPERAVATLDVFDMLGRKIVTLASGMMDAGSHSVQFDAEHLPAGIYTARLSANGVGREMKMVVGK